MGVDLGTGGCKVTVIDLDGAVAGEASVEYRTHYPQPGWAEQNPDDWFPALCDALAQIRAKGCDFARLAALAFDGSTHNAVLLDDRMRPVRDTIMWTDQRSAAECAELQSAFGDLIFTTAYQVPAPTWTLPQMLWLRKHEPAALRKTRHVLFVKDYVRWQLTGIAATDMIEAQGTLFFDMARQAWSMPLVELAGLDPAALPRLVAPTDCVGAVTAQAAERTGIPAGTPVVCGSSDSAVEDYGAGAIEPGQAIVKLATAGNVNVMTAEAHPHPRTLTYSHIVPGMWYTVAATNAAAVCQRWFRDRFCAGATYLDMNAEAARSPVGANGVFFHPYLQGERSPYWDPHLRGSFTGLGMGTTRGDAMRALLEGVAFSLRDCRIVIDGLGLSMDEIFLIGGGARSRLWSEIVCNVMNAPVSLPTPGDASFGSALLAGVGVGLYPDVRAAVRRCLKIDSRIEPDPAVATRYAGLFETYKRIHDALAPIYRPEATGP